MSGLGNTDEIAISGDGENLYAVSPGDSAIATFSRNTATGSLSFVECHSGITGVCGNPLNGGNAIPTTADGAGSGLRSFSGVSIHPNQQALFGVSRTDDAITAFLRNPDGELSYVGCFTGSTSVGSSGSGACQDSPQGTTASGADSGWNGLEHITISPDGLNLYAAAADDHSLVSFAAGAVERSSTNAASPATRAAVAPTATGSAWIWMRVLVRPCRSRQRMALAPRSNSPARFSSHRMDWMSM